MELEKKYYVYEYIDPNTNKPFYIGKGKGDRFLHHIKRLRDTDNPHKTNKIKKLLHEGTPPIINIIQSGLTESEAFNLENVLIIKLGRVNIKTGILLNLSDGGEGQSGWIPNDNYRKKMSNSVKGDKNGMFGKKHTEETKEKIKQKALGRKVSKEQKEKISQRYKGEKNPFYGKKHKKETIDLIRNKKKGRFTGENNFTSKTFIFTDPNGNEFVVKGNFDNFCKKNNLSIAKMKRNINNGFIQEPKKNAHAMTDESRNCIGWQIKKT